MELALIKRPTSLQRDASSQAGSSELCFQSLIFSRAEGYIKHMEIYHPEGKPQLAS